MNISNIITSLYERMSEERTSTELMVLAKMIEKLNTGCVQVVATYNDLLKLSASGDTGAIGSMYFVESDGKLYYNYGSVWKNIYLEERISAWTWGLGTLGRLGHGINVTRSSPVSVIGGFTDWIQVSGGSTYSLGLRANGTAWAWGQGTSGQLGDGTAVDRSSPVSVVGGYTDWIQVDGGNSHSLGLRANGTAWAWGLGTSGQLGNDTSVDKSSPVSVVGGFTDWMQVDAGGNHSLGVRANGTAWAWGLGTSGQLGNDTAVDQSSPVSVVGGYTDWIQVAAGDAHSLGLRADGTAWAWGVNDGRLGDGTAVARSSPVSVVGGFTDWIQVAAAGGSHSLGLRANGTAWAWGSGANGRLGDGTIFSRSSPVSVIGGYTDWIQVDAGTTHSLGLRANGTAWAWGSGVSGKLGDGTEVTKSSPVSVIGGFTDWIQVAVGNTHSLALRRAL